MSSSDSRIIKDAKISASPVVIAMHDFTELNVAELEQPELDDPADESATELPPANQQPEPKLRVDEELVLAGMLLAARDIVGGINWVKDAKNDPDIAKTTEVEKKNFLNIILF